jgi:hypothetical protein
VQGQFAKGLLWADRVAVLIPVVSMIVNEHRAWIVETFPDVGPAVLDALDTANRLAGYYGWGRLGFDGLRFIRSKLRPSWVAWRGKAPKRAELSSAEQALVKDIDGELESLVNELDHAVQAKVSKPEEAVEYVNEHPDLIEGKAGRRSARVNDEHSIVEVMDASVPSGIGCEYHSPVGVKIHCPGVMGTGPAEPAPAAFASGKIPQSPAEATQFLRDAGLVKKEITAFGTGNALVNRVVRLGERFGRDELKALGNFLLRHDLVLTKELVEVLLERVERGHLIEKLSSLDVVAEYAPKTPTIVDMESGMSLKTPSARRATARSGAHTPSVPKVKEPHQMAEEALRPILDARYGRENVIYHEIVPAPGANEGELLGSTIPEYYVHNPQINLEIAFEVKRWRLDEAGIGPAGRTISALSEDTVKALANARRQLGGRRLNLPNARQDIIFNVTGQGVTDVFAVGSRLQAILRENFIEYDHLFIQDGKTLTNIF